MRCFNGEEEKKRKGLVIIFGESGRGQYGKSVFMGCIWIRWGRCGYDKVGNWLDGWDEGKADCKLSLTD